MGSKEIIQAHNMDLQRIKEAIKALPSAKKWQGGGTIIPSNTDVVIPAYTDTELTVQGEPNMKPENIKSGVNVFGVTGSLEQANNGSFYIKIVESNTFTIPTIQPPKYIMYGARYYTSGSIHGEGFIILVLNSSGDGYTMTYNGGHYGQSASSMDEYMYTNAEVSINNDGSVTIRDNTRMISYAEVSQIRGIYG